MIETHYPHIDDLTDHHKEKIAELRLAVAGSLKKYPEYNTEFSLLRWLMGWDYNIEVIQPKIQKAIDILISLGMGDISMESPSEVNCRIRGLFDGAEYFPGGLMGQDDEGNVIYMQEITATHPRSLAKAGSVSELFRLCIIETEMAFKLVRHSEAKTGKKLGVKLIVDLDGFNMDLLYTPTLSVYLQLLTQLQAIFPDFTKKIYLINCPLMMKTVYAMIQPVLSKQTRDKICFLGNNWKDELISNIGAHNIYPHWGGTKPSENPKGDLRLGGKVPEELWYKPEENPEEYDKESFLKINVQARSKKEIKLQGKKGKSFYWIWRVSSGDLDFGILKDDQMVHPTFRCMTDFVPEKGQLLCREDGEYTFFFDNSHGKVWSKDVKYKITLK